jgi:hypothetical protein
MKHPVLLRIGWLAIGMAIVCGLVGLNLHWNFFDFHPIWDARVILEINFRVA